MRHEIIIKLVLPNNKIENCKVLATSFQDALSQFWIDDGGYIFYIK